MVGASASASLQFSFVNQTDTTMNVTWMAGSWFGACYKNEGLSKSFWTGRLERELQMIQLSATRCSCIAILWVSLVSFAAITLWRGQKRVIPKVSVYFIIDSVRKLLDTPSYFIFGWKLKPEVLGRRHGAYFIITPPKIMHGAESFFISL
jgi:hypothetical protein